jgi:hypothetical protein
LDAFAVFSDDIISGRIAAGHWAIDDAGNWHDLCAALPEFDSMAVEERR